MTSCKQQIAATFDRRKRSYDESPFHQALARRLLELAELRPGERVLDVATGTGLVAVPAAQLVGEHGSVTGIDLSAGMLARAREKAADLRLMNLVLCKRTPIFLRWKRAVSTRFFVVRPLSI